MGIEFLDLSESEREALKGIIDQFLAGPENLPVKVWFETLPQPIRARATHLEDGILLKSKLNFLRLNSQVLISPANTQGESYTGVLENITLSRNSDCPSPVLELHMSFQPDAEPEVLFEEPPPVLIIEPAEEEPAEGVVILHSSGPSTEGELAIEPGEPNLEVDVEFEDAESLEEQGLLRLEAEEAPSLPTLLEDNSMWDMSMPENARDDSQWSMESPADELSEQGRSGGHFWLWVAALLMLSVTAASMVHTGLWNRVQARVSSWIDAGLAGSSPATPVAAAVTTPVAAPVATPEPAAPAVAAASKVAEARTASSPPAAGPAAKKTTPVEKASLPPAADVPDGVLLTGDVLEIPLRGSVEGARHYRLADPDGVAVKLPRARPRLRRGAHRLSHGVYRLVWVRRQKDGGSQVRVMVRGELPPHRITVQDRAIRIELKPSRE